MHNRKRQRVDDLCSSLGDVTIDTSESTNPVPDITDDEPVLMFNINHRRKMTANKQFSQTSHQQQQQTQDPIEERIQSLIRSSLLKATIETLKNIQIPK
tara:strand:- start:155 stop:451 length:297 start_codon:yes stop_codon:yes gene_type:complete